MSNGLGAGFGALLLVAVLLGLAILLALVLLSVFVFQSRDGQLPRVLRYLSVAFLAGVIGTAGFGVAALYDEGPVAAGLFLALVFLPVIGSGIYLRRSTALPLLDTLTGIAVAWSLPFVLGLGVFFGVNMGIESVFDLAPTEFQQLGVAWWGVALSGVVAVLATILLGDRVGRVLSVDLEP